MRPMCPTWSIPRPAGRSWLFRAAWTCALLLAAAPVFPASPSLPPLRLNSRHWSYEEIEELLVAGRLDSLSVHTRPLSRSQIAWRLLHAPAGGEQDPRFRRLFREFAVEATAMDTTRHVRFTRPAILEPLGDGPGLVRISTRVRLGESKPLDGTWKSDPLSEIQFRGAVILPPHLVAFSDLLVRKYDHARQYSDPVFRDTDITFLADQSYLALSEGPWNFMLGRDHLRWGTGQSGSLLLGDAAPGMNMVEHELRSGTMSGAAMTAVVSAPSGQYLSTHRLEWQPFRRLNVALSEAARYQSGQLDFLYLSGMLPYTVVQRMIAADALRDTSSRTVRNNIMIAAEAEWRPVRGLQCSGTWLIDDLPTRDSQARARTGYQANLLATSETRGIPWAFRAEVTRIRNYVYSVFYGEDFIHQGISTGYPLGPDLVRISTRLSADPGQDLRAWLALDYLAKGEGKLGGYLHYDEFGVPSSGQPSPSELSGVVEKTLALDGGSRWFLRDNLVAEGSLGWRHRANPGHVDGTRADDLVGSISLEARW